MNKKHQITYTKPAEPAFLTEFKKRAGFIEADTVDTKVSFLRILYLIKKFERINEHFCI